MMKDMTTGNPTKLIFLFAMPMLIGNLFQQFYTMIDAVIVGKFVSVDARIAIAIVTNPSLIEKTLFVKIWIAIKIPVICIIAIKILNILILHCLKYLCLNM
ncbi:hypothetical protein B0X25_00015 [Listeria monocytogenes]|nr:hypothetical protein B0X25_00015 [Listeria monocytogenes]